MSQDTLCSRFEAIATQTPDRLFAQLVAHGRADLPVTYGEVLAQARRFQAFYQAAGLQPGDIIIIILQHGEALYASFIGAMLGGFIPSFMPFATPKQDKDIYWSSHDTLFRQIEVGAVVTYGDNLAELRSRIDGIDYHLLDAADAVGAEPSISSVPVRAEDVAFLQHSSGTTGLKKGVMLSHRAVLAQVDAYGARMGMDAESRLASWLPLYHDMGLISCFITPMVLGAQVAHLDPFEWVARPQSLMEAIERHRSEYVWLPNFAYNHLANTRRGQKFDLSSLKAVSNCSEPCKAASMALFTETYADCGLDPQAVQVCYAMAENTFAVTQSGPGWSALELDPDILASEHRAEGRDGGQLVVSCGSVIAGTEIEVRDENRMRVEDGVVGEVAISGTSLYNGYYRRPEATDRAFIDGWHHTGDLGFVLGGELYLTGRKDDLIISKGKNFYAHDLEASANRVVGVVPGRVVVFDLENPEAGSKDIVVMFEHEAEADITALRRQIRETIEADSGAIVARVVSVLKGTLLKTTSGKIGRNANRQRYLKTLSGT